MPLKNLCCLVLTCLAINSKAQIAFDSVHFSSPLSIPLILSGNFCELRSNHFHTGLDIKTQGGSGQKVLSVEDGYVSRIGYLNYGYGLVLYIDHPNGYTSVYAHLSKFNSAISKKVREIQQIKESETFDVTLAKGELPVKKGQLIALSGNSGSSLAPHLHFEIRETTSELSVNPLLFDWDIEDTIAPDIKGLSVYPLTDYSSVNGKRDSYYIPVRKGKDGNYALLSNVSASGVIGIGIHTNDRLNGANNICGVYTIDLMEGKEPIFKQKMTYMAFDKSRYINNHKDYDAYKWKRRHIHKSFIQGNNELAIYEKFSTNGQITMFKDSNHQFQYVVNDAYGNSSELTFSIKGEETLPMLASSCSRYLSDATTNYFDTTDFGFLMGEKTIYNSHCLEYKKIVSSKHLSDIHTINSKTIPVHKYFDLKIKPNVALDSSKLEKLYLVEVLSATSQINRGGVFTNGFVHAKVREYGSFALAIDTTAPYIQLLTKSTTLNSLTAKSKVYFKIGDTGSGIESYKVYIDNVWQLTHYIASNGKVILDLSANSNTKGKKELKLLVTDERGNQSVENYSITIN